MTIGIPESCDGDDEIDDEKASERDRAEFAIATIGPCSSLHTRESPRLIVTASGIKAFARCLPKLVSREASRLLGV